MAKDLSCNVVIHKEEIEEGKSVYVA